MNETDKIDALQTIERLRNSFTHILFQLKESDDELYEVFRRIFDTEVADILICDDFCARIVGASQILNLDLFDAEVTNFYAVMIGRFGKKKGILYSHFFDWCISLSQLFSVLDNRGGNALAFTDRKELFSKEKEVQVFEVLAVCKKVYCDFAFEIRKKDSMFYKNWRDLQDITKPDIHLAEDFLDRMDLVFTDATFDNLLEVSQRLNISSKAYLENPSVKILTDVLYFVRGLARIIQPRELAFR